jgi:hypothetical protein
MKKAWDKPELTILVRSKPEESVLGTCKGLVGVTGPNSLVCIDPRELTDCFGVSTS